MSRVIVRESSYHYADLKDKVFEMLDKILNHRELKGKKAVVKPNLLSASPPEYAITTHPHVIRAVSEYLVKKQASVTISDSPALGSFEKVLKECGIRDTLKGIPVQFAEFKESKRITVNPPFHAIELASSALEADLLINLPKLKTHSQMTLTLGVKNLFGCVVGIKKPQWHLRTGVDIDMFAKLMIEIYLALKPSVTLLDGILAMEGQGPGKRGTPRPIGVLMGSADAVALDASVAEMLDLDLLSIPINRVAYAMGILEKDSIEWEGVPLKVNDFKLPMPVHLVFGPPYLHGFMRKHLIQRPLVEKERCTLCLKCMEYCPAEAITLDNKNMLFFDYNRCIRCYCCVEICPFGAMGTKQPLAGKIFELIKR